MGTYFLPTWVNISTHNMKSHEPHPNIVTMEIRKDYIKSQFLL